VDEIDNSDLIQFNNDYILKHKFSQAYQNQVVNAVKLFYRKIQHKRLDPELIERPRTEKKLPNVLSKEEVKMILEALENLKHKTMLCLIYACGLRRSELLNLKIKDIDSKRGILIIRQSKGKKDRIVPLSEKIIVLLRDYYQIYKPKSYLFEGQQEGTRYSEKSLESVMKKAKQVAKINKPVTLHWLRHSYATHLLECGTDLRYIQELMGHKSSRTTEIYTHVSTKNLQQIRSPFDDL
jgi:integrase/recombinase XerD